MPEANRGQNAGSECAGVYVDTICIDYRCCGGRVTMHEQRRLIWLDLARCGLAAQPEQIVVVLFFERNIGPQACVNQHEARQGHHNW